VNIDQSVLDFLACMLVLPLKTTLPSWPILSSNARVTSRIETSTC
jgi:hypothetical protein